MIKKLLLAAVIASSFGTVSLPSAAATIVRVAPPPMRDEAVPSPRRGHVWVAGHWDWRNQRHQWIKGAWVRERPGYYYVQPTWSERNNGRWQMDRGNWRRGSGDRDRDGIPNRVDRDRDGDGVRNSRDRAPDNPNRN